MENSKASGSWWCNSPSSPDQHQWLLSTLSDLDKNISGMLTLILQHEGGEVFMQRTESSHQQKTQLQKRAVDLYTSYRCLAGYFGQLGSPSSSFLPIPPGQVEVSRTDSDTKIEPTHLNHESRIGSKQEDSLTDASSSSPEGDDQSTITEGTERIKRGSHGPESDSPVGSDHETAASFEQRISCSEQTSRVAEVILGELARRNNQKREANRVLQCQVEKMMEEGRALRLECDRLVSENGALQSELNSLMEGGKSSQSCPRCISIHRKQSRSHFSRFKSLLFGSGMKLL